MRLQGSSLRQSIMSDAGSSDHVSRPDELRYVWIGENPVPNSHYEVESLQTSKPPQTLSFSSLLLRSLPLGTCQMVLEAYSQS